MKDDEQTEEIRKWRETTSSGYGFDDCSVKYLRIVLRLAKDNVSNWKSRSEERKKLYDLLTAETEELHRTVMVVVKQFSTCSQKGTVQTEFPCTECF